MRPLILSFIILIGASLSRAEDKVVIEGHGEWGNEVLVPVVGSQQINLNTCLEKK